MTISNDLQDAIDALDSAVEKSRTEDKLGTGMMLQRQLTAIREIKTRYDNINDNES